MRRFTLIVVILAAALFAQGCLIVSIHPLYTENDIVFEEALLGVWNADSTDGESWRFERAEDNAYRMTITENGKQPGLFEAHLVKLGEYLFLDLYPEEPDGVNEFFISHVIPSHSIWRVAFTGDTLSLAGLNFEWLTQELEAGRLDLEYEEIKDMLVLTGEPRDLQIFVLKHPNEAFEAEPDIAIRAR